MRGMRPRITADTSVKHMTNKKDSDRFKVVPGADSEAHQSLVRQPGVVSGEIGADPQVEERLAGLAGLEGEFLADDQLNDDWEATAQEPSALRRIEALLDRINAHRQELDASDADANFKNTRQRLFSRIATRLRGLI